MDHTTGTSVPERDPATAGTPLRVVAADSEEATPEDEPLVPMRLRILLTMREWFALHTAASMTNTTLSELAAVKLREETEFLFSWLTAAQRVQFEEALPKYAETVQKQRQLVDSFDLLP